LVNPRLVGVGNQGFVCLEVAIARDAKAAGLDDCFDFGETDVSEFGAAYAEVASLPRVGGYDLANLPRPPRLAAAY
jgi:hypothetical protein